MGLAKREASSGNDNVDKLGVSACEGVMRMCEHRAKVVGRLLDQALTATKSGDHVWAMQKLIFAITYLQEQIGDLERQAELAADYQREQNGL